MLGALAAALASAGSTLAAPAKRRVGVLWVEDPFHDSLESTLVPMTRALAERGHVTGINLEITALGAAVSSARLAEHAARLVAERVDVLVTGGTVATRLLARATRTIPIVTTVEDPVVSGFAREYHRPGGNITGLAAGGREASLKLLEMMWAFRPDLSRVALLHAPAAAEVANGFAVVVRGLGLDVLMVEADPVDPARAVEGIGSGKVQAAKLFGSAVAEPGALARLAQAFIARGIAAFSGNDAYVAAGLLASHAGYFRDPAVRLAAQVDQILRGSSPSTMPFEFPRDYYVVVNRATAKALRVQIPAAVLIQADRLI